MVEINDDQVILARKGCGHNMGAVKCGDVGWSLDEHRGIIEFQVYYCKECAKKVIEEVNNGR